MPVSVVSAGGTKGPAYADASYRIAAIRKSAIIGAQKSKTPAFNPNQKPFIREQHLAGGFTTGVLDAVLIKHCRGFM